MRIILVVLLFGLGAALAWNSHGGMPRPETRAPDQFGEFEVVEIVIRANPETVFGRPWDGLNASRTVGVTGLAMGLVGTDPPDLGLCVVLPTTAGVRTACYHRSVQGRPVSLCPEAFECRWRVEVPRHRPWGMLAFDIDEFMSHDLVDVAVFASHSDDPTDIRAALRGLMDEWTPVEIDLSNWIPSWLARAGHRLVARPAEARRREAALQVFDYESCRTTPCVMAQSVIAIRPVR